MQSSRFSVSRLGNVFSRVPIRNASNPNLNRYPHTNTTLSQLPCTNTIQQRSFHGVAVPIPNSTGEVTSINGGIEGTRVEISAAEDVWLEREERLETKSRAATKFAPSWVAPAGALFHWLDLKSPSRRRDYFELVWPTMDHSSLHSIVLRRLNLDSEVVEPPWKQARITRWERTYAPETAYDSQLPKSLRDQGITQKDIEHWVWILSGGNAKEMLDRFLESPPVKDHMLLMRILKWDIQDVRSLRKVILHVWEHILRVPHSDKSQNIMDPAVRRLVKRSFTAHGKILTDDHTFMRLIGLLLYQVRRIWPAAMPSIANMLMPYSESILMDYFPHDSRVIDAKVHRRLCKLYNKFLHRFALPASINPLESMSHNWNAQRKLLEFGGQFQPPLILNERSYRAITTVLAASKKTARESKVTALRSRDWPPWRTAQDGMDAQSTPHKDSSRVLLALAQKVNSGYAPSRQDSILRIVGGQELDGTPTIHTRSLIKQRGGRLAHQASDTDDQMDPAIWAKRIEATRDVQEAWSAFVEYEGRSGIATQAMYSQMFMKLHHEKKRQSFVEELHPQSVAPGDGKEVLEVAKNNFSPSYQSQLEPPSIPALYEKMISSGIRPSGRFLNFLIQRASSITFGLSILRQSKRVSHDAWLWLRGKDTTRPELLDPEEVSDDTFFAVVHLLCRFSPNAAKLKAGGHLYPPMVREATASTAKPLSHAASLLKKKLPMYRPTWYTLFRALAKKDVVISRGLAGDPKNCILAWRALMGTLKDFHDIGLELDPEGFRYICSAAFNTFPVLKTLPEQQEVLSALDMLKREFAKLVEVKPAVYGTPGHLHQVSGYDLHLYIRVLGITGEYEEILGLLRWVVANCEYLRVASLASPKEERHMEKLFTAVRMFLMETEYVDEAKDILSGITDWEGWASDEEVGEYVRFQGESN